MTMSNHPYRVVDDIDEVQDTAQAALMIEARNAASEAEDCLVKMADALQAAGYGPWCKQILAGNQSIQQVADALNLELNASYEHVISDAEVVAMDKAEKAA